MEIRFSSTNMFECIFDPGYFPLVNRYTVIPHFRKFSDYMFHTVMIRHFTNSALLFKIHGFSTISSI